MPITALSLIPPAVVLTLAIFLRRPILALILGAVSALLLLSTAQAQNNFAEISLKPMQDETIAWLILVCGSFGALIALLVRTGGALAFTTGSSWGIFAVTIPVVMPLAYALQVDIPLTIGALLSASAFGSQACFYGDSAVLAARLSGCNLINHALTQLPYTLIAAGLAFVGFVLVA